MILVIYMELKEFELILTTNFNVDDLRCARGEWTQEKRGDRLLRPRRINGLLYLADHPAKITLSDGQVLQGRVGDVILLPKGSRYLLRMLLPPEKKSYPLLINFRMIGVDGGELVPEGRVRRLCRDEGSLGPLFARAVQQYLNASPVELKATVYALFCQLQQMRGEDVLAIDYIHRHYADAFNVADLAKRCAVSETTYRKQFRQYTGLSPIRYINRLKIEKACQMLLSEQMRLQEISDHLNFYSLPYFYKVFKEQMGCTPRQYLDRMAEQ